MSVATRNELRDMAANVALEIAREFGFQVTYTHRGVDSTVWVMPERDSGAKMREWSNTRARELPRTFRIPYQPDEDFPPDEDPMPDDTVTDENSFVYALREFVADDLGSMYTFADCINTKVKQVGAVGE